MTRSAVRLHVEAHGEGPVVVLQHGFGGSARNWGGQVRALRDHHRVIVFDARGHARSEAPEDPEAYRPECFVGDWADLVERHAPGERVVAGGLSMGAGVALRFALERPDRVRGLVLAAPPPGRAAEAGGNDWATGFADAIEREGLEAAGERYAWGERSGLDAAGARLVRQGFLEHPPHALAFTLRHLLAKQPPVSALGPELAASPIPALIVVGSEDRMSLAVARELAETMPDARLEVAPGVGHVVNLAARDLFDRVLREFLNDLPD